jgi:hypothetical protein
MYKCQSRRLMVAHVAYPYIEMSVIQEERDGDREQP